MKTLLIFFSSLFLLGCSNLSKNSVYQGDFRIASGVHENVQWGDELPFKRISWYQEATLLFDLMLVRIERGNPFFNWFSDDEKKAMEACKDSYVVMTYALDAKKISNRLLMAQAGKSDYRELQIPNFKSHLRLHPDFTHQSLRLYKIYSLCRSNDSSSEEKMVLRFPGYKEVVLP